MISVAAIRPTHPSSGPYDDPPAGPSDPSSRAASLGILTPEGLLVNSFTSSPKAQTGDPHHTSAASSPLHLDK